MAFDHLGIEIQISEEEIRQFIDDMRHEIQNDKTLRESVEMALMRNAVNKLCHKELDHAMQG